MSGIRVYEAARKLNIETKELMRILGERGAPVKSPISFISQSDFDDVLDFLTTSGPGDAGEEGQAPRISLVQPQQAEKRPEESPADVIPFSRPAGEEKGEEPERRTAKDAEQTAEAEQEPAPSSAPPPEKPPPAAVSGKPARAWRGQAILSFLALGVASAAMLIALIMNTYIEKNTVGVNEALSAAGALEGEMGALREGVGLNESMITENSGAIARVRGQVEAMRRDRARGELMDRSSALEELSTAFPAETAQRLRSISGGLRGLASSL
ncbi:MAG: translation initiation factor IF-2 N-terminal domain-containing protein [Candidatus Nitrospinota bacterium M3_3B_026]